MRKKREPRIDGEVAFIPLTRGYEAVIDLTDLALIGRDNWHVMVGGRTLYAARKETVGGKKRAILMHRVLVGATGATKVDHRDCDGLNNRRSNLRSCSHAENMRNVAAPSHNTSGSKGVSWCSDRGQWLAQIKVDGKQINLGRFDTMDAAQAAYADGAVKHHGEFARVA